MMAFMALEQTPWGQRNVNLQYDFYIQHEAYSGLGVGKQSPDIVFLDIDESVYRQWRGRECTPRGEIARLVDLAYRDGAKVIVVDINLEWPDRTGTGQASGDEDSLSGWAGDNQLRNVLSTIKNSATQTKVILPVLSYADRIERPNIYADLADNKTLFLASPAFLASGYDQVVRFWQPYQLTFPQPGQRAVRWSIPLLASALYGGDYQQLTEAEAVILNGAAAHPAEHFKVNGRIIEWHPEEEGIEHQYNRIRFFFVPPAANAEVQPTLSHRLVSRGIASGAVNEHFSLRDKIVLIGVSSADAGDMHTTPVGRLPGLFVHGNAINTLVHAGQTQISAKLHWWSEGFLIIVAAIIFALLPPGFAKLAVSLLLLSLLPIAYWYFLQTGHFINIVLPLVGIGLHETTDRIKHSLEHYWPRLQAYSKNSRGGTPREKGN